MINKIAVIGGTGMIGKPVARALHQAGFDVTVLARDEEKAKTELPGIAIRQGDIKNIPDIENLLQDQDAVYINLNLNMSDGQQDWHAEREGLHNILEVAKNIPLKRVAITSSVIQNFQDTHGFHWWVFDLKRQALAQIKTSGIPYTIFYPSTFMENFMSTYRKGDRILLAGKSHHKMYFIAGSDFGRQVARSFRLLKDENKEYIAQGPDGYTADEASDIFIRHYPNASLKISRVPLGMLKLLGVFSNRVNYGYNIIYALNNYPEKFEATSTWNELGRPTVTLTDYAKSGGTI